MFLFEFSFQRLISFPFLIYSETKPVKKTVKFADGILPGYGSSHSDSEQKTELSPASGVVNMNEKRKKKQKRRKKSAVTENNENQTVSFLW